MASSNQEGMQLDDVMLAMDVVDTLRRRQDFVERELNTDAREEELVAKVRRIYASQGIEVDDHTIEEGVKALRDERFAYRAPARGLKTRLLELYIQRAQWGKRIGLAFAGLFAVFGIYFGTVVLPEQQHAGKEVRSLNAQIDNVEGMTAASRKRLERLKSELENASPKLPADLKDAERAARTSIKQSLTKAEQQLRTIDDFAVQSKITKETIGVNKAQASKQLSEQKALLRQADEQMNSAEHALSALFQLERMPADIKRYHAQVKKLAKEDQAIKLADEAQSNALAALAGGDFESAQIAMSDLKTLTETLQQAYVLQVVSRPGEKSGVWRYPEINQNAKNYYLIVEAIGPKGKALPMPITSEEDGKTRVVTKWALRVGASAYNAVALDKKDDGIIQRNKIAVKRPGYLKPEYNINTTGAAITQW